MKLPAELRNIIYDILFVSRNIVIGEVDKNFVKNHQGPIRRTTYLVKESDRLLVTWPGLGLFTYTCTSPPIQELKGLQLMSLCRQIHDELQDFFYSRQTFSAVNCLSALKFFLGDLRPDALRNIRHLSLTIVLEAECYQRRQAAWIKLFTYISGRMQLKTLEITLNKSSIEYGLGVFKEKGKLEWVDAVASIQGLETFRLSLAEPENTWHLDDWKIRRELESQLKQKMKGEESRLQVCSAGSRTSK